MSRKSNEHALYVYMNNKLVGHLRQANHGGLFFSYAQDWLNWQFARPVSLSMPLTSNEYTGPVVYNYFDNLLPDSKLIRDRIQRRFGVASNQCFDLLFRLAQIALELCNY